MEEGERSRSRCAGAREPGGAGGGAGGQPGWDGSSSRMLNPTQPPSSHTTDPTPPKSLTPGWVVSNEVKLGQRSILGLAGLQSKSYSNIHTLTNLSEALITSFELATEVHKRLAFQKKCQCMHSKGCCLI